MRKHIKITDYRSLVYLILLFVSVITLFLGETIRPINEASSFAMFCFHYLIAAGSLISLLFIDRHYREHQKPVIWLMFLTGCFALNRCVNVFNDMTGWFVIVLLIVSAALICIRYAERLPVWARQLTGFAAGMGVLVFSFLAVYLIPIYPISIVALVAVGISIHAFVPGILVYQYVKYIRRNGLWRSALAGGFSGVIVLTVFAVMYNREVHAFNMHFNRTVVNSESELPAWLEASQQMDNGFVTTRVLKTGLLYAEANPLNFVFNELPSRNFGGDIVFDPLVICGSVISPPLRISEEDRIRLLESRFDVSHAAQERLWSGDQLTTSYINSKVKIWPELHLAYTEKFLTVTSHSAAQWRSQEAIYTFHLPEGSAVTALSLWINGKEEKGILTTKEKADTAYRTIVGVEKRDPSLVRWQEGSTVSVRVFPVASGESRMFKIGVTSPLRIKNDRQYYDNIYFEGPRTVLTTEDVSIDMAGAQGVDMPSGFKRSGVAWTKTGSYEGQWQVSMQSPVLAKNAFSFNGKKYSLEPYTLKRSPVATDVIYLDVNASWSRTEFEEVRKLAGKRPVKVAVNGQPETVTEENAAALFDQLHQLHFSIFPLQIINDPAHSLLVTKNPVASPSLGDLAGSAFKSSLAAYLSDTTLAKVRLMNIGEQLSPYLKALKESRVFRYEQGDLLQLRVLLTTSTFAEDTETTDRVVIDQAQLAIVQEPDTLQQSNAPDHLMRLFAYNHILRETGKGLITASAGQDDLVQVAREAYVVSPLSGLIVLETQKDYDRFDIKDSGASLKNASLHNKGAVPEPHEWALIIIAAGAILYLQFGRRWKTANV